MTKVLLGIIILARLVLAEDTEAAIQLAYWQAAARATAAQAAFRNSLTDQQKQMEAQRDAFGLQAETARGKMSAICAARKEVLDADTFTCKAAAPKQGAAKQ